MFENKDLSQGSEYVFVFLSFLVLIIFLIGVNFFLPRNSISYTIHYNLFLKKY